MTSSTYPSKGNCKVCGHPKKLHTVHIGPDHTGEKVKHIGCHFTIKSETLDFGLGNMPINHSCSCHGVKEHTYLKNGIKKYQKFLKEKTDATLVKDLYIRKNIQKAIRTLRQAIKDNPDNLLHWQRKELTVQ